jgi:hypothetical protein
VKIDDWPRAPKKSFGERHKNCYKQKATNVPLARQSQTESQCTVYSTHFSKRLRQWEVRGGGRSDKFLVVARKRFAIEGKATASTPMPAAWVNNLVARPDLRMV